MSEDAEHARLLRIDGERIVGLEVGSRPRRGLLALGARDDRDLLRIGNIDEDVVPGRVESKTFWMPLELDVADLLASGRVDDGKCPVAIADVHAMCGSIDAHIVGVIAERDRPE